jgi:hypothetical protein
MVMRLTMGLANLPSVGQEDSADTCGNSVEMKTFKNVQNRKHKRGGKKCT